MVKNIKFLVVIMIAAMLFCAGAAASTTTSGTCGSNAEWKLEYGVLTISGSGDISDFNENDNVMWHDDAESISLADRYGHVHACLKRNSPAERSIRRHA